MHDSRFLIHLGPRIASDVSSPPDDPLHEFSEVEMALRLFCYHHNRVCWFELDGAPLALNQRQLTVSLDPDWQFELIGLPHNIASLTRGEALSFCFGESHWEVAFRPSGDTINTRIATFGRSCAEAYYQLRRTEVLEQWTTFLRTITTEAVTTRLLPLPLAQSFLAPIEDIIER